jgi:hypothetical protein
MYHRIYMFTGSHPYLPKSPVLILTRDSDNQTREGEIPDYHESKTLYTSLTGKDSRQILADTRKAVFRHLQNTVIFPEESEMEIFNTHDLKEGADFFGTDRTDARYLAAVNRYLGGVFGGLGDTGRERIAYSLHHVLIVSAVYGLVKPFEPVQYCSCPPDEDAAVYTLWNRNDAITELLTGYIRNYEIRRILDFSGCSPPALHGIFRWSCITSLPRVEVFHACHRWGKGVSALPFFGIFLRDRILSARPTELMDLKPDTWYEDIIFRHEIPQEDEFSRLLGRGESAGIEFKSRALWSRDEAVRDSKEPPSPEFIRYGADASTFIIAKTLAGFLNTEGGDLIIGLSESGKEHAGDSGIEADYRHITDKGTDGYRAMIQDSVIRKYFDDDFFSHREDFLSISFPKTGGKTVCWIQVKKSDHPVFLDDGKEMLFFVRTVTQTREIRKINEIYRYTSQHFEQS